MTARVTARQLAAGVLLAAAPALAACDKGNGVQSLTAVAPAARVKFFNYGLNAPGVNFYANDTKVTAIGSATGAEAVLGTAYGSAASGGFYSSLAAGPYTFTGRVAAATDNGLAVASLAATVADGKAYSLYVSGPYSAAAKKVDAFVVEDAYPDSLPSGATSVRLVNAIYNAAPLVLYAKNTTTGVETSASLAVSYKGASAFVTGPPGTYDLSVRAAGSSANVATRAGVALDAGRVYTVSARGDVTVTGSTAANRPQLDATPNR